MCDYIVTESDFRDLQMDVEIFRDLLKKRYKRVPKEFQDVIDSMDIKIIFMKHIELYDIIIGPYRKAIDTVRGYND